MTVGTCHSYTIHKRFSYKCPGVCGTVKRFHRKKSSAELSKLNPCDYCGRALMFLGAFESDGTPAKPRKQSNYSVFCQRNRSLVQAEIERSPTRILGVLSPKSSRKATFAETQHRLSQRWTAEKRRMTERKARADAHPIILEDGSPSHCDSPVDFTGEQRTADAMEDLTRRTGAINLGSVFESVVLGGGAGVEAKAVVGLVRGAVIEPAPRTSLSPRHRRSTNSWLDVVDDDGGESAGVVDLTVQRDPNEWL